MLQKKKTSPAKPRKRKSQPAIPAPATAIETALLCRIQDPAAFDFDTTAGLAPEEGITGQARAIEALRFGIDITLKGFNIFVLGQPGSGRHTAVKRLLEAKTTDRGTADDWCYVHNFADGNHPKLLRLPQGRGIRLKNDMQRFVNELADAVSAAFESDAHRTRVEAIHEAFKEKEKAALDELSAAAAADGIALLRTPQGFVFGAMKDGEAISAEDFEKLPPDEKERIHKGVDEYSGRLQKMMHQVPRWRREMQERLRDAGRDTMRLAVGHMIDELKERYTDLANVSAFLDATLNDLLEMGHGRHDAVKMETDAGGGTDLSGAIPLARYQVNLLVDNSMTARAPVVFEDNPTFANLVGRVDHIVNMGMMVTNFTFIRAGALHRANGGYLVLDAMKVLSHPYAWEGLKRALRVGEVRVESLSEVVGLGTPVSLEPEPAPLSVKVVLVGERRVYYMLRDLDPEFEALFKVAADFEDDMTRSDENVQSYARLVATLAAAIGLRPFDRDAVARIVEYGARLAGDAERLSCNRRRIADLLREADHHAGGTGRDRVLREDVEAAHEARVHRAERLRSNYQEAILRNDLLVSVSGARVGQVNGLAVIDLGDFMFAHPVRITATARMGEGDVIDIERESELGGAIHSKGVMILSSFLGARFARRMPLALSASLVFEQSYGPVEGDSASLAELCALLSTLANQPIRQTLAVTGSVNQFGEIQAVGGVNEKIEGFFDICKARGLSDGQGVLIPTANIKNLMLREDVVTACANKTFAIYAADHVDRAIEILTGTPAGEPDDKGAVPENSINYLVAAQLLEMSMLRQNFSGRATRRKPTPKK